MPSSVAALVKLRWREAASKTRMAASGGRVIGIRAAYALYSRFNWKKRLGRRISWARHRNPKEPQMLYRDPIISPRFSLRSLALAMVASYEAGRRRRRAELDLRTMSPYLRRDLGLIDGDLSSLMD